MAKDDGGLLGAALDVFKAGANEVDIFTSDKTGPDNTSGSGSHTSEPNSMGGGWGGGSSESSGDTTHHRSSKGRLTGETVKNGNRLDHYGPPGTFGIGGREPRGHSQIGDHRVDHYNNSGDWVGYSWLHDDGKIENFDRQSELRHVTWGSPDNAVAVELNTGSSPGGGGGWSGSSTRQPRPSIKLSPAADTAIAYVAAAVFVLLIVAYLGFMIFGSSSGKKSQPSTAQNMPAGGFYRESMSKAQKRQIRRQQVIDKARIGKKYKVADGYYTPDEISQGILDGKISIDSSGNIYSESKPAETARRKAIDGSLKGQKFKTFREYNLERKEIEKGILDGTVTVLEDGTVTRK